MLVLAIGLETISALLTSRINGVLSNAKMPVKISSNRSMTSFSLFLSVRSGSLTRDSSNLSSILILREPISINLLICCLTKYVFVVSLISTRREATKSFKYISAA